MFDIDIAGLRELEGGKPPYQLAFEPVSNVFDEYRRGEPEPTADIGRPRAEERTRSIDLDDAPKRPSFCHVCLDYSTASPRGTWLTVTDDGPGFADEKDIWTIFGSTSKRSDPRLAGRFNFGEKQLIALARKAQVCSRNVCVTFENGRRNIQHFHKPYQETTVTALMPWGQTDMQLVRQWLKLVRPPQGLEYALDGVIQHAPEPYCQVKLTLPTVRLADGAMHDTMRKARVDIVAPAEGTKAMLYELGIPVCDLGELGFPWSLDVQQKIPVPMSRDTVQLAYLYRVIGGAIEQAALQEKTLLTQEEAGASFVKGALDWVRDADALREAVHALYGQTAVRISGDAVANATAASQGRPLIPGQSFTEDTRRRLQAAALLPTSREVCGPSQPAVTRPATAPPRGICPRCHRPF